MDEIPEDFIQGSRMYCPWCQDWDSILTFTLLHSPPGHDDHCVPIFKHGGPSGCKRLFSPVMTVVVARAEDGSIVIEDAA